MARDGRGALDEALSWVVIAIGLAVVWIYDAMRYAWQEVRRG